MSLDAKRGLEGFREGEEYVTSLVVSSEMVERFTALTGDAAPIHLDVGAAREMGYSDRVSHGLLVAAHFSTILGMYLPGPSFVIHSVEFAFAKPVYVGQTVTYRACISAVIPSVCVLKLELHVLSVDGEELVRGKAQCGLKTRV